VDSCEEELFSKDHTTVWSRTTLDGTTHVMKSFTLDSPVQEVWHLEACLCSLSDFPVKALWCSFLLPVDVVDRPSKNTFGPHARGWLSGFELHVDIKLICSLLDDKLVPMKVQSGVCVVESWSVNIFTSDGRDYTTALPFPVCVFCIPMI
jgi:hypothetical protein